MATRTYGICKDTKCARDVYTQPEIDNLLDNYYQKSEAQDEFSPRSHNHDGRYYTETEVANLLNNLITTWTYERTTAKLTAGSSEAVTIDASWSGYTILGLVGVHSSGTSNIIPRINGNNVVVTVKNDAGIESSYKVSATVLYRKNI